MKRMFLLTLVLVAILAAPVLAHHPAEGMVDEEIYAMIDELVADTPHAEMTFDTMGGTTDMVIETDNFSRFEDLVEGGLVSLVALLDGDVTMTLEFDETRDITISIIQIESMDKAAVSTEVISLDGLKADFR